jgi:predicted nucleic acid-binding protein
VNPATERILIDTGPLVALLHRNDAHHAACVEHARELPDAVYTCWPVITEACYLLRSRPDLVERLLETCHDGVYDLLPLDASDVSPNRKAIERTSECEKAHSHETGHDYSE